MSEIYGIKKASDYLFLGVGVEFGFYGTRLVVRHKARKSGCKKCFFWKDGVCSVENQSKFNCHSNNRLDRAEVVFAKVGVLRYRKTDKR